MSDFGRLRNFNPSEWMKNPLMFSQSVRPEDIKPDDKESYFRTVYDIPPNHEDKEGVQLTEYGKLESDKRDMESVSWRIDRKDTTPSKNVLGDVVGIDWDHATVQWHKVNEKGSTGMLEFQHDEAVNHPDHYGGDVKYEVIKVVNAWHLEFNLGNAVKYLARAGKKNDLIEDLLKAIFYIEYEAKRSGARLPSYLEDDDYKPLFVLEDWELPYLRSKAIEEIYAFAVVDGNTLHLAEAVRLVKRDITKSERSV